MIATINITDSSTLWDNLIASYQVDYMSSVLIPAEAVENDQELVYNWKVNTRVPTYVNNSY